MTRYRSALVVACGVALAAPSVAFAQETPVSPTVSTTATPPAMQYPFVALSPAKAAAGEDVLVSVGCAVADFVEVKSMVLDRIGKFEVTSEDPVILGAVAHIGDKAKPGFYAVKATCKKTTVTINLEVTPGKTPTPPPSTSKPSKASPSKSGSPVKPASGRQVSKIPVGAPQTGGGGGMGAAVVESGSRSGTHRCCESHFRNVEGCESGFRNISVGDVAGVVGRGCESAWWS